MPIEVPQDSKLRLLSFADGSGAPRLGFVKPDGRVVDVASAAHEAKMPLGFDGTSMLALIEAGPRGLAEVSKLAAADILAAIKLDDIKLLPPIPKLTRNIYLRRLELSRALRGKRSALRAPRRKSCRTIRCSLPRAVNALNGPFDPIPYDPSISQEIDWEVELAVIIGKRGRQHRRGGSRRLHFRLYRSE